MVPAVNTVPEAAVIVVEPLVVLQHVLLKPPTIRPPEPPK
jgi:hypothetical protein